jgi:hypothetical protein
MILIARVYGLQKFTLSINTALPVNCVFGSFNHLLLGCFLIVMQNGFTPLLG